MSYARQTIVQQAKSFEHLGFETHVKHLGETCVILRYNDRIYRFSDPDENIIINQLVYLYQNFKPKSYSSYIKQHPIKRYY
jgi:hypothetical protein